MMTAMPSQAGCVGSPLPIRARAQKSAVAHKSSRVVCTTAVPGEDANTRKGARLVPKTTAEPTPAVGGVESDDEKSSVVKRFNMKEGTLYVSHVWKAQRVRSGV